MRRPSQSMFGLWVCATFRVSALLFAACAGFLPCASAIGQDAYVEFSAKADDFPLVARKHAAQIYVDPKDFTGVVRATSDLQLDIQRVSGRKSPIVGELGQL